MGNPSATRGAGRVSPRDRKTRFWMPGARVKQERTVLFCRPSRVCIQSQACESGPPSRRLNEVRKQSTLPQQLICRKLQSRSES